MVFRAFQTCPLEREVMSLGLSLYKLEIPYQNQLTKPKYHPICKVFQLTSMLYLDQFL